MFSCDEKDKQLFVYFIKRMIGETPDILGLFFIRILTERFSPWEKKIHQLNPRQKLTYQKYSKFYRLAECFLHSAYNYIFPRATKNFYSLQRVFRVRAGVFHHCLHKWDLSCTILELITDGSRSPRDDFLRNQGLFLPLLYRQRNVNCPWLYGRMNICAGSCPCASPQQVKRYFRAKHTLLKLYPQISNHRVTRFPSTLCDGLQSRNTNDRSVWQGIPPTIKLLSNCMCNDPPAEVLLRRYLRYNIGRKHLRSKIAGDILQTDNRIIISRCLWNFVILLGKNVFPKLRSPIVWNSDNSDCKLHPLPHIRRRKLPHQYPATVVWGGATHFDYWCEPGVPLPTPARQLADAQPIQEKLNKLQRSFPEVLKTYIKLESYETGRETGREPAEMLHHVKEWEKEYTSVWKGYYNVSDLPAVSYLPSQDPIKVIEIHDILSHYIVNFI